MSNDFKIGQSINWEAFDKFQPVKKAWGIHNRLKLMKAPTKGELITMTKQIPFLVNRALFIVLYLTAGRVSEVVEKDYLYKHNYMKDDETGKVKRRDSGSPIIKSTEKIPLGYPGIKKSDFSVTYKGGRKLLVISIHNRKNKKVKIKNIPIPYDKEGEFIRLLDEYLDMLKDDQSLFPFSTRMAEYKIEYELKMNPHTIRAYRATRLVVDYNFSEYKLMQYMGWANGLPAAPYMRQNMTDIIGGDY